VAPVGAVSTVVLVIVGLLAAGVVLACLGAALARQDVGVALARRAAVSAGGAPVTEQTHDEVDWAGVERRAFRRQLLGLLLVPVLLGAIVVLTGRFAFWEGDDAWWAVLGFVVYGAAIQAVARATRRRRSQAATAIRVQYAVRHHVDPGPELRDRADRYARHMAGNGWFAWLIPFVPTSFVLDARWDRLLLTVPAILVLGVAVVATFLWWRRLTAASRRWIEDPPGAERESLRSRAGDAG